MMKEGDHWELYIPSGELAVSRANGSSVRTNNFRAGVGVLDDFLVHVPPSSRWVRSVHALRFARLSVAMLYVCPQPPPPPTKSSLNGGNEMVILPSPEAGCVQPKNQEAHAYESC